MFYYTLTQWIFIGASWRISVAVWRRGRSAPFSWRHAGMCCKQETTTCNQPTMEEPSCTMLLFSSIFSCNNLKRTYNWICVGWIMIFITILQLNLFISRNWKCCFFFFLFVFKHGYTPVILKSTLCQSKIFVTGCNWIKLWLNNQISSLL